ncbi:hypothetical protein BV22DRAFT_1090567 [Leucogyrophana mollusca]|uniref:Uncharacterized protein n=1 Tax=Leucogyrophana mollusca TaxID=85980 RepID=A0ACB8BH61_9AGAM|nr:hypothetical protein BV22DRAFT_1090567 [Leucogyrophana mollusca]
MSDYSAFGVPDFDANEYANTVLAGDAYPPGQSSKSRQHTNKAATLEPAKEDISVAISKLDLSIEDVSKQIKTVVTSHHEGLLLQAASVNGLSGSLTSVRRGLDDVDSSLEKLRQKIRVPYQSMQAHVTRLERIRQASDLLRRTSRFVVLAKRLELQMSELAGYDTVDAGGNRQSAKNANGRPGDDLADGDPTLDHQNEKERTIAKAALTIAESVALLDTPDDSDSASNKEPTTSVKVIDSANQATNIPLSSVNAVAAHIPFIDDSRAKVTGEMESMVLSGLTTLNQSLLASSLQTAYNLRVLPKLVQSLVSDLSEAVDERIRSAFDLSRISKEVVSKDSTPTGQGVLYKSRIRTEPTNITAPQWTAALWNRLEILIEEMTGCCIKVYALEKVLKLKKDPVTQVTFLDEAMKLLENKPSSTFWTALGRSLEKYARDAAKGSTFLQQTLSAGYPKLLRLFHEFFAKIAVHTDTVYSQTYQSPETVLVLRALSNSAALYLSRSSNRMNEAVGQAFAGGSRAPPGANEGLLVARTVTNELDSARFDPLLVLSVAKNAASSLDMLVSRADALIVTDRSAVTLLGPMATPQQVLNGQISTCMHSCWSALAKVVAEHTETVSGAIGPSIKNIKASYERVLDPLLTAIRRELGSIVARLHRVDLQKPQDPMSGMGGSSLYMKDLVDKLSFIKLEVLSTFASEVIQAWVPTIVKFVIRIFIFHASIAKPLGESGKLQLTTDMTELEFALSAFLVDNPQSKRGGNLESVGDEYKVLRAMRPLLFLENSRLASPESTAGLPPLIVLHHILVRSPIPLPHTLHGWQEAEYVRWIDEHSDEEAWTLFESGLSHWEKMREVDGSNSGDADEYIELARIVLGNAKMK